MKVEYQICIECVMDTTDPDISFDSQGVCNYCRQFKEYPEGFGKIPNVLDVWLGYVEEMKKTKPYNCVMGISGGVDSSFLCHVLKEYDLNPIVVHVDNGFNSEIAKRNMKRVLNHSGFDIEVCKANPEEFRSLELAFLRASVIDADLPADYAIEAFQYRTALRHKLKFIMSGWNFHSEAFMPETWTYRRKIDHTNLRNIHDLFGEGVKLKHWVKWGALEHIYHSNVHKLIKIAPLNYLGYTKKGAIEWLKKNLGWQSYKDKHGENILSRFYQRYILFFKFGIDKRKAHYSNLIRSGGMTRNEALKELEQPPYDPDLYEEDRTFVLQKLRLSEEEFDRIMALPIRTHEEYGTDERWYKLARKMISTKKLMKRQLRKLRNLSR